jgi:endogenous inhibitor of DNA gyrase (YacG/DUF329 family)
MMDLGAWAAERYRIPGKREEDIPLSPDRPQEGPPPDPEQ